jgi:hypothetical protein
LIITVITVTLCPECFADRTRTIKKESLEVLREVAATTSCSITFRLKVGLFNV